MAYSLAANALALLHFAFILFVVLGGLLVLGRPKLAWIHVPAAIWGTLIELYSWYCPLTTWENRLLRLAGEAGYQGGFIEHYIFSIIYPAGLTRATQIALAMVVLVVNGLIYLRVIQRAYRTPRRTLRG